MQLVRAAGVRADLLGHPVDGGGIELAQLVRFDRQAAAQRHRAAAAIFQRRVIEEGERPPVEDLVREHGGLGGVPHDDGDPARLRSPRPAGSGRRCPWPHAGSPRASGGPGHDRESPAARAPRSPGRRPGSGRPRPSGRRIPSAGWPAVLLPAAHPQHGQGPVQVPPPPRREHRGGEHRLPDHAFHRLGGQEPRDLVQRELCCGPRDSKIASSLAAACSSKSKVTQNRLRSASPRARLSRAPNGACPTSCIPPLSSKNRSSTMVSMSGSTPSWASPAPRYAVIVSAASSPIPHSARSQAAASAARSRLADRMPAAAPPPSGWRRPPPTARSCGPGPRRARTGRTAARPGHRPPAPRPARPGGSATRSCRAGTRRRPWTRSPSPRSPSRPGSRPARPAPGSHPAPGSPRLR